MAITVSQVAPLDARAGFSQSISVAYGNGLNGTASYGLPASLGGTGAPSPDGTTENPEDAGPNWLVIAAVVGLIYLLIK